MDSSSLRIVHTVSSLQGGGMEHFVLRLCESQRKRGHDSSVVAITGGPLKEIAEQKGVPLTILRGNHKVKRVAHTAAHFAALRPDIIHCHNPTSLHYASVAKLVCRARLVFTDHAQTKGIVRMPRAFEWSLVDAFASVSAETASHAVDIGYQGHAEVVHNGVEFTPARRSRAEMRAELGLDGRVVGINVASFFSVKAQDILIRGAAELKKTGVPVTVVCVGDGGERPIVEKLAADLGLTGVDVRFLGFRNDVADLLVASDFFVLPSRSEGFPMSILEAMSHRLPVVCTPVGGNPELVTDGEHGYLVPVDDAVALAAAMGKLVGDEAHRIKLGEAGYARVKGDFSFDRTTDRYDAMYRRVLGARRRWGLV
jgi:glycosyltransferase involved in cell wall biosynthesis